MQAILKNDSDVTLEINKLIELIIVVTTLTIVLFAFLFYHNYLLAEDLKALNLKIANLLVINENLLEAHSLTNQNFLYSSNKTIQNYLVNSSWSNKIMMVVLILILLGALGSFSHSTLIELKNVEQALSTTTKNCSININDCTAELIKEVLGRQMSLDSKIQVLINQVGLQKNDNYILKNDVSNVKTLLNEIYQKLTLLNVDLESRIFLTQVSEVTNTLSTVTETII